MYVCALASDSKLVTSYLSNESYYCVNPNRIMLQTSLLSLIYRSNMDFIIRKEILTRLFSLHTVVKPLLHVTGLPLY